MTRCWCLLFGGMTYALLAQTPDVLVELTPGLKCKLPRAFVALNKEEIAKRFGDAGDYLGCYLSPDGEAQLLITRTFARWDDGDAAIMQDFLRANILSLYGQVDSLVMAQRNISRTRRAIFVEFVVPFVADEPTDPSPYTYMAAIPERTGAVLLRFSCPRRVREKWRPVVVAIMNSLHVER